MIASRVLEFLWFYHQLIKWKQVYETKIQILQIRIRNVNNGQQEKPLRSNQHSPKCGLNVCLAHSSSLLLEKQLCIHPFISIVE